MQLNIYVSKDDEALLRRLDELSKRTGRAKSAIVLEALQAYVERQRPALGVFRLGEMAAAERGDLYRGRLDRV